MQKDAEGEKTKKNPSETKPDGLTPKAIECKKTLKVKKENPSEPKPDGLKPKAIKCKKTLKFKKQTKKHRSLNPTDLNQRQKNAKRR